MKKKGFALIITIIVVLTAGYSLNVFAPLTGSAYDLLNILEYIFTPPENDNIVIVKIDALTLEKLGNWPLNRTHYARAVDILAGEGADTIGIDILFASPGEKGADEALAGVLAEYNNIVLPAAATLEVTRGIQGAAVRVEEFTEPLPEFRDRVKVGHINYIPDRDGIIRRLPLRLNQYSAFSHVLAGEYGRQPSGIKNGNILINFSGPAGSIPAISFYNLLQGNYPAGLFHNKMVLIGAVAPGLGDRYMTPFSRYGYISGVELNAQTARSLLQGDYYRELPFKDSFLLMLFFSLLAGALVIYYRPKIFLIILIPLMILYLLSCLILFFYFQIYLDPVSPLLMVFIISAAGLIYWYIFSEKEKGIIKDTFARYLAPEVMEEVLRNPGLVKVGGRTREVTVLFIDIRDFTVYARGREAGAVVDTLNRTFAPVTEIIFSYNGTLDKYLGDGLMAFFGAPLKDPEHPESAVKAALEIQEIPVNNNLPFRLGIGINTGPVLVGNIGTRRHMEYTVIGDPVNRAARFVEMAGPGEIILGPETGSRVKHLFTEEWQQETKEGVAIYRFRGGAGG